MTIDVDKIYEQALALYQDNRYEEALNVVRDAKTQAPDAAPLYYIMGQLLVHGKRYEEAVEELQAGMKVDAKFEPLHLLLVRTLFDMRRFEDALAQSEAYGDAFEKLDPKIIFYRADCSAAMRDWEAARDEISHAIKIGFDAGHAHCLRSMYNYQLNDWQAVVEDSSAALQYELPERERVICLQNRGAGRLYTQDFAGADEDLSQAIALDPEDYLPYFDRAKLYEVTSKIEAAERDLNRGIELCECGAHVAERGEFYLQQGRLDDAVRDFEHAVQLDDDPEYADLLAEAMAKQAQAQSQTR